MVIALAVLRFG